TATLGRDDVSDRMGPNNIVLGWQNTKPLVAFRTRMRVFNAFLGELFTVGMDADLPKQMPVPRGGFLSFSPDDAKMVYNRVFREFRTWKFYRGGMADDVWLHDFKTGATENLTNHESQDICPMWASDNRIYFISDRDGRMNLYSIDLASKETKQHTSFKDFDIKFPSVGRDAVVFENAGYIWRYDLASGQAAVVPIDVKEDFASGRGALVDAAKHIQGVSTAPDGQRVVTVARGDVFSVPAKDGVPRNLTRTSNAHERDAVWSPDGKWIAYNSDATGENELYIRPQDGKGDAIQVTSGADTYYYAVDWSPDSKKLLWSDRLQRLRFVDVTTKTVTLVDQNPTGEYESYAWSPDSQWITFGRPEENGLPRVYLYSLADKKPFAVTDEWYGSSRSVFSDDGKFLLFVSARDFRPTFGEAEFSEVYRNMERIYILPLAKDTENPLGPRSDEVGKKREKDKTEDEKKSPTPTATPTATPGRRGSPTPETTATPSPTPPPPTRVEVDGMRERVIGVEIPAGNYNDIHVVQGKIFYLRAKDDPAAEDADDGDARNRKSHLCVYNVEERKETVLGDVNSYEITHDGKKMLVRIDKEYAVIDLPKDKLETKDKVIKAGALDMMLDRHAEWLQIYNESWRQMRDFFYAPNMHGVDWKAQGEKYRALVPFVNHRNDLTYLIGELISELNVGHAYVGGGERPETPRVKLGLLGAELSRDAATKAYKIERILPGENWDKRTRSPLTAVGVNLKPGDYILAVNGTPVASVENIFQLLIGQADRQVILRVNSKPADDGARDVTVVPTSDESPLYYLAWVQKNVDYVNKSTN
ncbi:MAG TPA: PDZ domain-containing protein, partial [Chthoniobacterales bacterium]|nr:PDZ domain-containing protein [Chthoniobacterales bacterium]